ncbi:unnamed protein product [Lota lota]
MWRPQAAWASCYIPPYPKLELVNCSSVSRKHGTNHLTLRTNQPPTQQIHEQVLVRYRGSDFILPAWLRARRTRCSSSSISTSRSTDNQKAANALKKHVTQELQRPRPRASRTPVKSLSCLGKTSASDQPENRKREEEEEEEEGREAEGGRGGGGGGDCKPQE